MGQEEQHGSLFDGKKESMPASSHLDGGFDDRPGFNFSLLILSLTTLFAVLATLLLWWTNQDNKAQAEEQTKEKQAIISQITSANYTSVEKKAQDFAASVSALSAAAKERYSMTEFLSNISGKLTKDVTINNLSVSSEGTVSITGTTKSYRSIADFAVALKSWDKLTEVDLKSFSLQIPEDGSRVVANFSATAKIVKTPKANTNQNLNTNSSSTSSGSGGINPNSNINLNE